MKKILKTSIFLLVILVTCYCQNVSTAHKKDDLSKLINSTYFAKDEEIENLLYFLTEKYLENKADSLKREIEICLFYNYIKWGGNLSVYFKKTGQLIIKEKYANEEMAILNYLARNTLLNFGVNGLDILDDEKKNCRAVEVYSYWSFIFKRDLNIFCLKNHSMNAKNTLLKEWLLDKNIRRVILDGMNEIELMSLYILDCHILKTKARFSIRKKILAILDDKIAILKTEKGIPPQKPTD